MKSPLAVNLNVGGSEYKVSRLTLRRYPDSMLAKLVSAPWTSEESSEAIFVDRDGPRFQFVLDFLRDGRVHLPYSVSKQALMTDFAYFGLPQDADIREAGLGLDRLERAVKDLNDLAAGYRAEIEELNSKLSASETLLAAIKEASGRQTNRGKVKYWHPMMHRDSGVFHAHKKRVLAVAKAVDIAMTFEYDQSQANFNYSFL